VKMISLVSKLNPQLCNHARPSTFSCLSRSIDFVGVCLALSFPAWDKERKSSASLSPLVCILCPYFTLSLELSLKCSKVLND
jgi:hypothetical protein